MTDMVTIWMVGMSKGCLHVSTLSDCAPKCTLLLHIQPTWIKLFVFLKKTLELGTQVCKCQQ